MMDNSCEVQNGVHFKYMLTRYIGRSIEHVPGLLTEWTSHPLFSGFLALLALAIYTGVTVTFFGKRFLDWRFSWSYIIGWVAIILAFAAGIHCFFLFYFFMYSSFFILKRCVLYTVYKL